MILWTILDFWESSSNFNLNTKFILLLSQIIEKYLYNLFSGISYFLLSEYTYLNVVLKRIDLITLLI